MSKAQFIHELGPPNAMHWQDSHVPDPAPGEVRLRHTAVGVNFADTYHRGRISHPWIMPPCPVVIGFEGVGIEEGVGDCTQLPRTVRFSRSTALPNSI
jgi:NADPH:quinone reductase-like Zn-dependent oxidoreductase